MSDPGEFNGYDYGTTLQYFRFVLICPSGPTGAGETWREWFERCHGIGLNEFKAIVKERETDKFYRAVGDTTKPLDLNQERKR